MSTTEEQAAAYEASRRRITEFAAPLSAAARHQRADVPGVERQEELIGHLAGLLEDRAAGRMPTGGFEEWTNEQVARHRDEPIDATLAGWNASVVEISDAPPSLAALSFDAVSHEHDLYVALGAKADLATDSVRIGAERAAARMGAMLQGAGAPGVVLTSDDRVTLIEGGADPIALTATDYAFMRLVTGRVSRAQAEAMAWAGDPSPVIDALFTDNFFTLQPVDVLEGEAI